jgi:integrase
MLGALYKMGFHSLPTVRGFRSTVSTLLNDRGHNPDVIERLLSHKAENKVRATYNRAEYLDQRKWPLQWWEDYLDYLMGSKNKKKLLEEEEKLKMWYGGKIY